MMDALPLYPVPYHPDRIDSTRDLRRRAKHLTRTQQPVNYFITDFGMSKRYDPAEGPPLEMPLWGGDRTVPEFLKSMDTPCDPFPTDVYCLGNFLREFTQVLLPDARLQSMTYTLHF